MVVDGRVDRACSTRRVAVAGQRRRVLPAPAPGSPRVRRGRRAGPRRHGAVGRRRAGAVGGGGRRSAGRAAVGGAVVGSAVGSARRGPSASAAVGVGAVGGRASGSAAGAGRQPGLRGPDGTAAGRSRPARAACSPSSPGTEMTMFESPSVTTSASATPRPLTRCSMIWRASSRSCWAGAWPSGVRAVERDRRPAPQVEAELRGAVGAGEEDQPVRGRPTIRRNAPKYRPAGMERLATVVLAGSEGAVGRPSAGRAGGRPGVGVRRVDGSGWRHLQDRRPARRSPHARRGRSRGPRSSSPRPATVPWRPAGGHDRRADGQRLLHRLRLACMRLRCRAGSTNSSTTAQRAGSGTRKLLHDRCASLPRRTCSAVGAGPGRDPLGCVSAGHVRRAPATGRDAHGRGLTSCAPARAQSMRRQRL